MVVKWLAMAREIFFWLKSSHHRLLCWCRRAAFLPRRIYEMNCRGEGGLRQINFTSLGREEAVLREKLERGHHSCKDATHLGKLRWQLNEVPPVSKPALKREVEGPNWRVQSQPAGGSAAQPRPVVTTYKWRPRIPRSSSGSRKARKLDFDLKSL